MRILLSGGGTGGHIYPALSLARHAAARDEGIKILFVGTEKGLESTIVPGAGFELVTISARGYQRKLRQLGAVVKDFASGLSQARKILRSFKPDVVLGTGGYVAAPVVLASVTLGIPAAVHEQNAIPGLANRYLAPLVKGVCLSFAESGRRFPPFSKTLLTGNPRASEAAQANPEAGINQLDLKRGYRTIVVYGGSRGALHINMVMVNFLKAGWLPPRTQLVYITGSYYYEQVVDELGRGAHHGAKILPYLDDMPSLLAAADLVVTRSGATTLAEITALGLPAVLIPSPNVVNNHQYHNARLLADKGAAVLVNERDFNHFRLRRELENLWADPARLVKMGEKSNKMAFADAAERIYLFLQEISKAKNREANKTAL